MGDCQNRDLPDFRIFRIGGRLPVGVALHRLGDGPGQLRYLLFEHVPAGFQLRRHQWRVGGTATVVFLGLHGDELAAAGYQGSQLAQLCIGQRAQRRVQGRAEVGQRLRVQLAGLGRASAGSG